MHRCGESGGEFAPARTLADAEKAGTQFGQGVGAASLSASAHAQINLIDDVITDGASKRESVDIIRAAGAQPVAVLIALDRMERGGAGDNLSERSAVEDFERDYAMPVIPVATVADLMEFLTSHADPMLADHADAVARYRERYGV